MSFAEFAARYSPLKPPPALVTKRRRGKGPYRRKTKSGFHIGDRIMTRFGGVQTVGAIRNWPSFDGQPNYWIYCKDTYFIVKASECERVV